MQHLFQAAEDLTSDRLYAQILNVSSRSLGFTDALILVPADNDDCLFVVEVQGVLPDCLSYPGLKTRLNALPGLVNVLPPDITELSNYQNVVRFEAKDARPIAYLVFNGDLPELTSDLKGRIYRIASLLSVKRSLECLPEYERIESKLKYQLTFLTSAINNIFEPFGLELLIQLSMEIISEMFTFPSAIALIMDGNHLVPRFVKGSRLESVGDLVLQAEPFISNRSLRMFPSTLGPGCADQMGDENSRILRSHKAQLIVPLTISEKLVALIVCISPERAPLDSQDQLIMIALGNILNRSLELSETRANLTSSNLQLDKKVFTLSTVYNAAQRIFSQLTLSDTAEMVLDMITEIFQSGISSLVFLNNGENRYDLLNIKSAFQYEDIAYSFLRPQAVSNYKQIINYRSNPDDRSAFLEMFPDFENFEARLSPAFIAQLFKEDRYYGFITLSDRVTGQDYSADDLELLQLMLSSTLSALDNAWLYDELKAKNDQLDRKIADSYAIQDVIGLVRRADDMDEFLAMLKTTLEMGAEVSGLSLVGRAEGELRLFYGPLKLNEDTANRLLEVKGPQIIELTAAGKSLRVLAIPLATADSVLGYLTVEGFNDTVLEDADRTRLLSVISSILSDKFAALDEKTASTKNGITDYPSLIWFNLNREIDTLRGYGLPVSVIKFKHPHPFEVISSLRQAATGFVLSPAEGVLISHLPENEIRQKITGQTSRFKFVRHLSKENLYNLRV